MSRADEIPLWEGFTKELANQAALLTPAPIVPWRTVGDPGEPAFTSPWHNTDATIYNKAQFCRDAMGFVHIRGIVQIDGPGPSTMFVLPNEPGYRPLRAATYVTNNSNIFIRPDGAVRGGPTDWVALGGVLIYLDGIRFATV